MVMNEKSHKSDMQIDIQKSFTFSGMISDSTMTGIVKIPMAATKITKEKVITGSQLNASTGTSHDFNNI